MKKNQLSIVILLLLSFLLTIRGEVKAERAGNYRFVVPGDSITSTTCTREDPCDLRYAIDFANSGDIIIVHSGLYTPQLMGDDFLFIDKSLTLLGSCTFDETTPYECHPYERSSILDAENSKRVIRIDGISWDEQVHIEGFTIKNGYGFGPPTCYGGFDGCGGGILASNLNNLTLKNNTLRDNKSGNTSGAGGALNAYNIDYLVVDKNSFLFNQATETGLAAGGAAFVANSGTPNAVVFSDNLIVGNETNTDNTSGSAGAGLVITSSNNVQVNKNSFEYQNSLNQNMDLRGSSIYLSEITGYSIEGNKLKNNWGRADTYISYNTEGSISKNKWWNNTIIYNLELVGNVKADIFNNFLGREILTTASRGGGTSNIYLHSQTLTNDVDIYFNTFAAATVGVDVGQNSFVDIFNNIFTELSTPIYLYPTNVTSVIDNNLFYDNSTNLNQGTNPIITDPKLVDVANGDFHLLPGSGAIDTAYVMDFDEDIDGETRPIGLGSTPYDVGADEFQVINYLPLILQ